MSTTTKKVVGATPIMVELLLHSYYDPTPHPKIDSGSFKNAAVGLQNKGLVTSDGDVLTVTARGSAWVKMIVNTPLPELHWLDPREERE